MKKEFIGIIVTPKVVCVRVYKKAKSLCLKIKGKVSFNKASSEIVEMLSLGGLEWKLKFWRVKELLLNPHHKQQVYIWSLKTQVKQSSWGFNCSNDDDFCNARHDSCAVNHCNFMPDGRWRLPSDMMFKSV